MYTAKYEDDDGFIQWAGFGAEWWTPSLDDARVEAAQTAYDINCPAWVEDETGKRITQFAPGTGEEEEV